MMVSQTHLYESTEFLPFLRSAIFVLPYPDACLVVRLIVEIPRGGGNVLEEARWTTFSVCGSS